MITLIQCAPIACLVKLKMHPRSGAEPCAGGRRASLAGKDDTLQDRAGAELAGGGLPSGPDLPIGLRRARKGRWTGHSLFSAASQGSAGWPKNRAGRAQSPGTGAAPAWLQICGLGCWVLRYAAAGLPEPANAPASVFGLLEYHLFRICDIAGVDRPAAFPVLGPPTGVLADDMRYRTIAVERHEQAAMPHQKPADRPGEAHEVFKVAAIDKLCD